MKASIIKRMLIASGIFITANLSAQHSLEKIWQTDSILKVPESVLYDAGANMLFVSNINGLPMDIDGKGSIGKISTDGKIIDAGWVTGLNAPKGMGLYKNLLYVADMTEVVVIDIEKGTVDHRIPIEGSVMLNDLTVDVKGVLYVSDSRANKVHRIENRKATVLIEEITGPNGVLAVGSELYILSSGSLLRVDPEGNMTTLAEGMDSSTDGIEMVTDNEFIVSCWSGIVYYIKADGSKEVLLDTRAQGMNSADIGYDARNKIVYVPTFYRNSVFAYQLR